jgi:hypothetical protein
MNSCKLRGTIVFKDFEVEWGVVLKRDVYLSIIKLLILNSTAFLS